MQLIQQNIETTERPLCYLCGTKGVILYANLSDRLYHTSGLWSIYKCPKCELLWLNPAPKETELWKTYVNYYTHQTSKPPQSLIRMVFMDTKNAYISDKYGYKIPHSLIGKILSKIIYLYPARRADFDFSVFFLKPIKNGKILDVGCGSGIFIENMANLGWNAEGIDFDKSAILNALSRNLKVSLGDLKSKNFESNYFDVITLSHVIEHVSNPIDLLKECFRILKENGRLMIATPNNKSLAHKIYKISWFPLEPPRHLFIFNPQNLIQIAKLAGFKKINVRTSIRGSAGIFIESKDIKKFGHYDVNKKKKILENIKARFMEYLEWFTIKFNKNAGEEIILSSEK